MTPNSFVKTHGLGNEYVVLDANNISFKLDAAAIQRICNIHYGIGSDGILLKVHSNKADVGLRIFNPDASEAEKSGNGLRIFAKYVYDYGIISSPQFTIETPGGIVRASVCKQKNGKAIEIEVDMGSAIFESAQIPTLFETAEVIDQELKIEDKTFLLNCVSVGNPHCVIIKENLDITEIKKYGSLIEHHPIFPNRINVQFAKIINREMVEILIWERGAGFTLASGSSSCAVASILKKKGLIENAVTVKMLGGKLKIEIESNWNIKMTGEVRQICEGILSDELLEDLAKGI